MALTEEGRALIRETRDRNREIYGPGKLSTEQREQLLDLYVDGVKISELAKRFGVTRQTIAYHIYKAADEV